LTIVNVESGLKFMLISPITFYARWATIYSATVLQQNDEISDNCSYNRRNKFLAHSKQTSGCKM